MKLFLGLVIFSPAHMARLCVVAGGLNFILSQRKFASKMNCYRRSAVVVCIRNESHCMKNVDIWEE